MWEVYKWGGSLYFYIPSIWDKLMKCHQLACFVHGSKLLTSNAGVPCVWGSGWFTAYNPAPDCHLGPQHQQCAATKTFKNGAYVFRSSKQFCHFQFSSLLWPPHLPLFLPTLLPTDQADPNPGSCVCLLIFEFFAFEVQKKKKQLIPSLLNWYKSLLEIIYIWNMIFEYLDIVLTILDLPYHRFHQDKNVQPDLSWWQERR